MLYCLTYLFSFLVTMSCLFSLSDVSTRLLDKGQVWLERTYGVTVKLEGVRWSFPFSVEMERLSIFAEMTKLDVDQVAFSLRLGEMATPSLLVDNLSLSMQGVPIEAKATLFCWGVTGQMEIGHCFCDVHIQKSKEWEVQLSGWDPEASCLAKLFPKEQKMLGVESVRFCLNGQYKDDFCGDMIVEGYMQGVKVLTTAKCNLESSIWKLEEGMLSFFWQEELMGSMPYLARFDEEVSCRGMLSLDPWQTRASWRLDKQTFCVDVAVEGEQTIRDVSLKDLAFHGDLLWYQGEWAMEFTASSLFANLPMKVKGELLGSDEALRLKDLVLELPEIAGVGEAVIDLNNQILQGSCSIFSEHQDVKPLGVQGHLISHLEVTTLYGEDYMPIEPKVTFSFDSSQLEIGQSRFEDMAIHGHLDHQKGCAQGEIEAFIKGVQHEEALRIEDLSFQMEYHQKEWSPFSLTSQGDISVAIKGGLVPFEEALRLFISEGHCTAFGVPVELNEEAVLLCEKKNILFEKVSFLVNTATCSILGSIDQDGWHLSGEVEGLELEKLPQLPCRGQLAGTYKLSGDFLEPELMTTTKIASLFPEAFPDERFFPADGTLECRLARGILQGKGELTASSGVRMSCQADLPLSGVAFAEELPFSGSCLLQGEIAPFVETFLNVSTLATGEGRCRLEFGGMLGDPKVQGVLEIENGSYESLFLGSVFQDIVATFALEGNTVRCRSIEGVDPRGGRAKGSGYVELDAERGYPFRLDLDLDGIQMLNVDYASCVCGGSFCFSGDEKKGRLEGELEVREALVRLPDSAPPTLTTVDVIYVNQSPQEPEPTQFSKSVDPWQLGLDLRFVIPSHLFVRSTSFHSEWKGLLELKGTTEDPLVFGRVDVVDSLFSFNGKNYVENEGSITFSGDPVRRSNIYLIARESVDELKIEVILKGPVTSPELAFRSNPPKTTREILSWLLFDRGLGEISAFEGEELTQRIIKLNEGVSSGPNFLDKVKASFGIDRIELTGRSETDPEDVSLRVGKYLHKNLFLSLKTSMNDKPNQASLEADLTHNFKATCEVGDDAEAQVFLRWEKDY